MAGRGKSVADRLRRAERSRYRSARALKAWSRDLSVDVFKSVETRVVYKDEEDYDSFAVFYLRSTTDPTKLYTKVGGGLVAMGNTAYKDAVSSSVLFKFKGLPYIPLTRFAWWYHHGVDCGGNQFPHTGGCRMIDTHLKNVHPHNLVLVNYYDAYQAEFAVQEYLAQIEANLPTRDELIQMFHLKTAVKFCRLHHYDDPLRDALARNPDLDLKALFLADPLSGTIYDRSTGEEVVRTKSGRLSTSKRMVTKIPTYVEIAGELVPAANVMWFLCTGTFAGKLGRRNDGYTGNIRLRNLKLMQTDYRRVVVA